MKFILKTLGLALLLVACFTSVQFAQDIVELKPSQKSVILFDFQISKWLKEARATKLDAFQAEELFSSGPLKGFKLSQIERIYGSTSLPERLSDIAAMRQGISNELRFEIFVQIKFDGPQTAGKFEDSVRKHSKVVQLGGKEFLQSKEVGPKNFVCRRLDDETFELGTLAYCQQDTRVFLTDRLKQIYRNVPDQSLRIAIDLETPSELVGELVDLAIEQGNDPIKNAYYELVRKANSVIVSHSLSADNMLTLRVGAQDAGDAEKITAGLKSALVALKLSFYQVGN